MHWRVSGWLSVWILVLAADSPAADVTDRLERMVTPYFQLYPDGDAVYARNPWDLQAFAGRLYIGAGNSANGGPAPNAGPVPLFSWDPRERSFRREFSLDDEQLDRFVVIGDTLFIPGHDARESWAWGNLYRRRGGGGWEKLRTIPGAIHVYDLASHEGRLYAALGMDGAGPSGRAGSAVAVSDDDGASWRSVALGGVRAYGLLRCCGVLYATDLLGGAGLWGWLERRGRVGGYAPVHERVDDQRYVPRRDLRPARLFPDTRLKRRAAKVARAAPFGERALYLGAYVHNDHQSLPFGAYVADSLARGAVAVRRVALEEGARPTDLLVRDGRVLLLVVREEEGGYRAAVRSSTDLEVWEELFHFRAPTLVRSFEWLEGDFYFALGSEITSPKGWRSDELHPETGVLLRLRGASADPP